MSFVPVFYAPLSQVESANLNDIQNEFLVSKRLVFPLWPFLEISGSHKGMEAYLKSPGRGLRLNSSDPSTTLLIPVPVVIGSTITDFHITARDTSTGSSVRLISESTVNPTLGNIAVIQTVTGLTGALQNISFGSIGKGVVVDEYIAVEINSGPAPAGELEIRALGLTVSP